MTEEIKIKKYTKDEYKIGKWSGGTTTELGIYPAHTEYAKRNFLWRLSSATVDIEESDFTSLPDYDRVLMVLEGEVVLAHKEVRAIRLAKYEQDRFSGGYETKSYGKITDFNLMVRKGNEGFAEALDIQQDYKVLELQEIDGFEKETQGVYCTEGFCTVNINDETVMLNRGELFIATGAQENFSKLGVMGQGRAVRVEVFFNEDKELCGEAPEEIAEECSNAENKEKEKQPPVTAEDIKWAALVCWSNFRGGNKIFRCFKDTWFDKKLQKGINKIECIFLPFIIFLIGITVAAFYGVEHFSNSGMMAAILLWALFDVIVVSPLLYLMVLPRPVKSHIKKIAELEGEEREQYIRQMGENPMAEKILKKYKITGRNKYID
ncbi:MAG: HutD family protein [Anaerovoracaceae bacterium]